MDFLDPVELRRLRFGDTDLLREVERDLRELRRVGKVSARPSFNSLASCIRLGERDMADLEDLRDIEDLEELRDI